MRALARRAHPRRDGDDSGFGLIELLVALSIFMVVSVGLLYALTQMLLMGRDSRAREVAANIAAQQIDRARSVDDLSTLVNEHFVIDDIDSETYTVDVSAQWQTDVDGGAPCGAASGTAFRFKRVSVTVTWENQGAHARPVTSDTIVQPGRAVFDPTKGNLAVQVLNGQGTGASGVRVEVRNSAGTSVLAHSLTDADGCAFFVHLDPSSYQVGLSATDHVDIDGDVDPDRAVTITAGETAKLEFSYDEAAELVLAFPEGYPAPTDLPLTLANTHILPAGTRVVEGSGQERVVGPLFPFSAGYTVWAGTCNDADPLGRDSEELDAGERYWPAVEGRSPALSTEPGGSQEGPVELARIDVLSHFQNQPLYAYHAPAPGCGSGVTLELGSTDEVGRLRASLPWGTWDVYANNPSSAHSGNVTLEPGTTDVTYIDIRPGADGSWSGDEG